jgi:competence CoiA-like predicted nuclease
MISVKITRDFTHTEMQEWLYTRGVFVYNYDTNIGVHSGLICPIYKFKPEVDPATITMFALRFS